MEINYTADSILEMNQPFSEFMKQFPSEEAALTYYKHYVERQHTTLPNESPEIECRVIWKKFVSKKRKTVLDYIFRYYFPSAGWKDLTFETTHKFSGKTYSLIRRRLIGGRLGRILCLLFGFNAFCIIGAMVMLYKEEYAMFQEDPFFQNIIIYSTVGAIVVLTITMLSYPYFKKLSNPEKLRQISRGFFVVDKVIKTS
jgi:hypothetical protein